MHQNEEIAFPRLTDAEMEHVKASATPCEYADGEIVFRAGQADIDLCEGQRLGGTQGGRVTRRSIVCSNLAS
jgi:hypothetical protein